ncbi:MAG: CRISPR-associated endonuclease Cas3'', partial [Candidatus Promineifilaceae bacterium]
MRPALWPEWLEGQLLAKSEAKVEGGEAESLAQHTWLVLSRLADWIRLRPNLPQQVGQPRLWHCLYWGAFLHDFGKAMPGFQGVLRGNAALREQWGRHRHEVFSLAFLDWITDGLDETERLWTAAAIVSHHRDQAELNLLYPSPEPDEPDALLGHFAGLTDAHLTGLHRWLSECGWAWAEALGLAELGVKPVAFVARPEIPFAARAVGRIRHWLRAYDHFVRQLNREYEAAIFVPLLALRGLLINADHSASAHE